jgi:flagellar biosynthesis/type III secretory pathway protein FliH
MRDRALDPIQAAERKLEALLRRDAALDRAQAADLEQAAALLAQARATLQAAQGQARALHDQARRRARAEVYQELNHLLLHAREHHRALLEEAEPQLLRLALGLARRMVGHALRQDPALVTQMVRQALACAQGRSQLRLRVHPDDLPHVLEALPDLQSQAQSPVDVQPDPEVSPGGCHLDTEASLIEVDLDLQVQALRQALGLDAEPLREVEP